MVLHEFREIVEWTQPQVLGGETVKNAGETENEIMNFQSELDLEGSTANRIVRFGENGCISHSTVENRWYF